MAKATCTEEGCGKPQKGRGLCPHHYYRALKDGSLWDRPPTRVTKASDPEAFICSVDGCGRPKSTHGFCQTHHSRQERYGDPLAGPPIAIRNAECSIDGCLRPAFARGLCPKHYSRLQRHGDPTRKRAKDLVTEGQCSVTLGNGSRCSKPCKVGSMCAAHYQRFKRYGDPLAGRAPKGSGSTQRKGYRVLGRRLEHRVLIEAALGRPLARHEVVHHRNGIRTDNRLVNLELRTTVHPSGQSVEEMLDFCRDYIQTYGPVVERLRQARTDDPGGLPSPP